MRKKIRRLNSEVQTRLISTLFFFANFAKTFYSDALYNIAQWEVFLRIIYNELIKSSHQISTLNGKLDEIYQQIQMAVQTRTAVPTRQGTKKVLEMS